MSRTIRLAVLEADTPLPQTCATYGSYGGVFTSFMHKGADASQLPRDRLAITGWDVVNLSGKEEGTIEDMGGDMHWRRTIGYPKLEDVDAILITGSRTCVIFPLHSHLKLPWPMRMRWRI